MIEEKATPKGCGDITERERLDRVLREAQEANELFVALEVTHEADGILMTHLANMLRQRMWRTATYLQRLADLDKIPF